MKKSRQFHEMTATHLASSISILKSINKRKNFHDFVFRTYQYATMKKFLVFSNQDFDLCLNSETFMFLINKNFLLKYKSDVIIRQIKSNIEMKNIEAKIHDSSEYVKLDLYIHETIKIESTIAHFKTEFHFINDLKTNVLINMNVMKFENIILNFEKKIMMISTCQKLKTLIAIQRKKTFVNRTVRAVVILIIFVGAIMTVSVRVQDSKISFDKNYSFFFKADPMLKSKNDFFAHVTDHNLIAMQIRNISKKSYVISKNLKIEHFRNFEKKKAFWRFQRIVIWQWFSAKN